MAEDFWQLSDFADKLGIHFTTANTYFKNLEKIGAHYVNRSESGHKIYDNLDLQVGLKILELKEQNWKIKGIYALFKDNPPFEMRPFPEDFSSTEEVSNEIILAELKTSFKKEIEVLLEQQAELIRKERDQERLLLEERSSADRAAARQQDITDRITANRVRLALEIEALEEWSKLDPSERMIKAGLFRKVEDISKRDLFVKKFVAEKIDEKLRTELELNNENED
ncbi:hypothetical protein [Paenibacillus hubeiensis]|uniref:hypothetical protein n=1 Tax=Paenibacillus hubeiensis TaxID=3077330 RepID=UPI0031BAFD33